MNYSGEASNTVLPCRWSLLCLWWWWWWLRCLGSPEWWWWGLAEESINWSGTGWWLMVAADESLRPPECWRGYKVRWGTHRWPESAGSLSELEDVTRQLQRESQLGVECLILAIPTTHHSVPPPLPINSNLGQPQSQSKVPSHCLTRCCWCSTKISPWLLIVWCWMLYVFISVVPFKSFRWHYICTNSQVTQYTLQHSHTSYTTQRCQLGSHILHIRLAMRQL